MPELESLPSPRDTPVRILVVEDEPLLRSAMAEALRDHGATVIEASTGDEAWEYILSDASIDVVFTDHRMPGNTSGAQLAARVRRHDPSIEIVVTSAFFDGQKDWAGRVLNKPYPMEDTAQHLASIALRRRNGV